MPEVVMLPCAGQRGVAVVVGAAMVLAVLAPLVVWMVGAAVAVLLL